jgi:hypothetical protein
MSKLKVQMNAKVQNLNQPPKKHIKCFDIRAFGIHLTFGFWHLSFGFGPYQ